MLFSLFSALAVGLAIIVAIQTLVIPFVLGLCDRRDTHRFRVPSCDSAESSSPPISSRPEALSPTNS